MTVIRAALAAALTVALLAAPLGVRAQPATKSPRVGIVWLASFKEVARLHEAFLSGLRDAGYADGRSIVVEVRTADGNMDRLPGLVGELLRSNVDVIVAPSTETARAAKAATMSAYFSGLPPPETTPC